MSPTLIIAAMAAAVGFAAFWSNPGRSVNRGFFAGSLFVAAWLVCLYYALPGSPNGGGTAWSKATAILGAAIFVPIWFIKEAIVRDDEPRTKILWRGRWWALACVILGAVRSFKYYAGNVNLAVWVYIGGMVAMYGTLGWQTWRELRFHSGLKRLELQIAALGACATGLLAMIVLGVRTAADSQNVMRLLPVIILVFYTATVIAITTSRIFNARQLLLLALEKTLLVLSVALAAFVSQRIIEELLPTTIAWLCTTAVAIWMATLLGRWFDRIFRFYPEATAARQAAFTVAQRETRLDRLDASFRNLLQGWGQTDHAIILSGAQGNLAGSGIELPASSPTLRAMHQLRWATPERLARERRTPDRAAVAELLSSHDLGAVVLVEGHAFAALVGVGIPASRRPFTYPQITQLLELASIVESALERAHISAKAQHTEQLATVGLLGASLAHEIRNPLVSIKTFVQLLPTHHQDPLFREKFFRLIGEEVGRIDQLTEQLLDLASPRTYTASLIELHPILHASLDLVAAKAVYKHVKCLTQFDASPDIAYTDASAAKQVMLNLCFNAIQAVEACTDDRRWIRIHTRNTEGGIEMSISDGGPGIAPEMRPRLFQPFQTTKSTGFGLGLAICSDILANLDARITVDPPAPDCGATFRVTFPCQPSSS